MDAATQVPVLLYHYIGECPPCDLNDPYRAGLWITENRFEEQLRQLRRAGYCSVSLPEISGPLDACSRSRQKAVVLTFDDGQEDNYTLAFPQLLRYGLTATFFINSDMIGNPGFMSWENLREMSAAGMAIEGHTATHFDLTRISSHDLKSQLERCRAVIKSQLGQDVRVLAYPGGHYNANVIRAVRDAGYQLAVTTLLGQICETALFEIPRIRVNEEDSITMLEERLRRCKSYQYTANRTLRRWGMWRFWKKLRKGVGRIFERRRQLVKTV